MRKSVDRIEKQSKWNKNDIVGNILAKVAKIEFLFLARHRHKSLYKIYNSTFCFFVFVLGFFPVGFVWFKTNHQRTERDTRNNNKESALWKSVQQQNEKSSGLRTFLTGDLRILVSQSNLLFLLFLLLLLM